MKVALIYSDLVLTNFLPTMVRERFGDRLEATHFVVSSILPALRGDDNEAQEDLLNLVRSFMSHCERAKYDLVISTCSSISNWVDRLREEYPLEIMKIEEPMLRLALNGGGRMGLFATVPTVFAAIGSTLAQLMPPTADSSLSSTHLCDGAFEALKSGNGEAHDLLVVEKIRHAIEKNDIQCAVLTQASMERVRHSRHADGLPIPIFTSISAFLDEIESRLGGKAS